MKRFLVLLVAFVSLHAFAQDEAATSPIKFGYLSYQAARWFSSRWPTSKPSIRLRPSV